MVNDFAKIGGYRDQSVISAAWEDSRENNEYLEKCRLKILENFDLVKTEISKLNQKFSNLFKEGASYVKPYLENLESGSFCLLDFSGLRGKIYNGKEITTGLDVAKWLADSASVGIVPGGCFLFKPEDMLVRVALRDEGKKYQEAFEAMNLVAEKIQNSPNKSLSPIEIKKLEGEKIKSGGNPI